jgi:O-antigen/teichoic acid export membrane protein
MAAFAKSFLWLTVAEFLFYASGYVVHMGAGRILGVEDYGRYTLVITITILVANLIGAGLPLAMGKFLSAASKASGNIRLALVRRFALWQTAFLVLLGGGFFLCSKSLALALGDETLAPLFQFASLIIPAYGIDLHYFHYYSGLQRFDVQAWLKAARALLRMSVILALAYWFHISGMIAGYILVPLSVFFIAFVIDRWRVRPVLRDVRGDEKEKPTYVDVPFRRALLVAISAVGFLVIFELLVSFDVYVLKYFIADDAIVGEYSAALTVARIPTFLFYALTILLLPTISESDALHNTARARKIVSNVFAGVIVASIPMVVIMIAYAEPIISILFGMSFSGSAEVLRVLGVGVALLTPLYVLGFAFLGAERGYVVFRIALISLVSTLMLSLVMIPAFGTIGAAWTKVISGVLTLAILSMAIWNVFGVRFPFRVVGISLFFGGILFAICSMVPPTMISLFVVAPIGTLLYIGALRMSGVLAEIGSEKSPQGGIKENKT